MTDSPVDLLLEELKAKLNAERTELVARVNGIAVALEQYRRASEEHIAYEFAVKHGLKRPKWRGPSPQQAAERLYRLVADVPELDAARDLERKPEDVAAAPAAVQAPASEASSPDSEALINLLSRCEGRKLVVIGALSGRQKHAALPPLVELRTEWIDTERDGVHAIGNLPQRIRQQRVAAIVILDKAIQHKHSEPLLAAARDSHTPVAFAGKGGKASLLRALVQLDQRLRP